MATIIAKRSTLEGYVLGVNFLNGKAETDAPTALAFFEASPDYTVEGEAGKAKAKPADPAK